MSAGPELALIADTYKWPPEVLRELTDSEVQYYAEHIPLVAARSAYGIAQLNADFREMFFPRYLDPDPNPSKEPPRRRDPWTVDELLPPFAWFERPEPVSEESLAVLRAVFPQLPGWAQKLAPL